MSVETYISEPITPPRIEGVAIPAAFWDDLLSYRPKTMTRLSLQRRDSVDRLTYRWARQHIESIPFKQNERWKGQAYALGKVSAQMKQTRYGLVCEELRERQEAIATSKRVPCGARKKTGAQCRAMAVAGKNRCKHHGGQSTGPRTLDGMRRALSCLPQYRANPDALEDKLASYAGKLP